MPPGVTRGIFPLVRSAGCTRSRLSLGLLPIPSAAPLVPPFFCLITGYLRIVLLTTDFIKYEPSPGDSRLPGEGASAGQQARSGNARKRQQIQRSGQCSSRHRGDRAGRDGRHHRPDPAGRRTRPQGRRHRRHSIRSTRSRATCAPASTAMSASDQPGVACVLDVRTMHANGGSVIIEAREPRRHLRLPRALGRRHAAATTAPTAARPPTC